MGSVFEREENAYTLGVQAGLWGYPLTHRVDAFPKALAVHGIGLNSLQKVPPAEDGRGPVRGHAEQPHD
jgi:hypothetical protein